MSLQRRLTIVVSRFVLVVVLALAAVLAGSPLGTVLHAQGLVPGRNVNMVAGTSWPNGDPYLQRQNEPSVAASTRNPLHLLAGANDYRTVDIPFVAGAEVTGDAWLGLFKSFDGGQRWQTNLLPGYPQDMSVDGLASPLKGYQAGADPVVRPGTNGLLYYAGIVFDRVENGRSAVFVSRFIDNNNKENGDPIAYLGTKVVASNPGGTAGAFIDKPWMAVDIPRAGARTCTIPVSGSAVSQQIRAGNIYVVYSVISGTDPDLRSTIMFTSSTDCGERWSRPVAISSPTDPVNQGATIAIDPRSGAVSVAWRVFGMSGAPDAMMVARSSGPGRPFQQMKKVRRFLANHSDREVERWVKHEKDEREERGRDDDRGWRSDRDKGKGRDKDKKDREREDEETRKQREWNRKKSKTTLAEAAGDAITFDQATQDINAPLALAFRTSAYPTMTFDGNGRAYLAWTERGYAGAQAGDARVVISTSLDGVTWTPRQVVEDPADATSGAARPGHQIMPAITFGGGRVVLLYYDLRDDASKFFGEFIDDKSAAASGSGVRHTLDLRAAFGTGGATPVFEPSVRVSDYLSVMKRDAGSGSLYGVQAQFNPPNLPMFKQGTAPFMGDYVDVALAPAFVPTANGGWAFNTNGAQPVFHAVWTDNRDVRQPAANAVTGKPDWTKYTPPVANGGVSRFDPNEPRPVCDPNLSGSRNQNIYTARLTAGLLVGSPGNAKPLSTNLQRAFVVFAQNTGPIQKVFRLTIGGQPIGGRASFTQFGAAVTAIDVTTPPRSMASRSVYVTSSNPDAQIRVDVAEVATIGGAPIAGGLADVIVLNPDIANPDIANPDIANPDTPNPDIANPDIANKEVYNPDIANPDIANPDIANPDIANPDIANPDIANPDIANPDIANPDIANPDIANPDIANPDIANVRVANPDIANPDIANPDIANPDIANPDIANPDIANPDIANPDIANPDIANASLTDVTWTMTNNGNTTAAFNVNLFLAQQTNKICPADTVTPNPSDPNAPAADCITTQLILRKVYNTPITGGIQNGVVDGCSVQVQSHNILLANIANPRFVTPGQALLDQNDPSAENATVWLAPGETAKITLRVYDPNKFNNVAPSDSEPETSTDPDQYLIDPIFLPTTTTELGAVTPVVQQQSVDTADIRAAVAAGNPLPPVPPVVTPLSDGVAPVQTPTPTSLLFVDQPSSVQAGAAISPAVTVAVRDQYGALLPNWPVTLFLVSNPANASLTGAVATSDALGVASFPAVTISSAGLGYSLAATAGTALPAVSNTFDVGSAGPSCSPLVVTTTADTNVCGSLRFAIDAANASVGSKTITFEIAEPIPHVMTPTTALPAVDSGVVIDATTDPHYLLGGGQPVIQISGASMPAGGIGLALKGTGSTVRGLEFNGFAAGPSYTGAGVRLRGGGGHTVQASHFGMIAPNYTGILVESPNNIVGGTTPGAGNTVGGPGQSQGIWINSGSGNVVQGNFVGNNGATALGVPYSNGVGILVYGAAASTTIGGAASTTIGGAAPGARNVISGNNFGISLVAAQNTTIEGNYIGLDAAGTDALANDYGVIAYDGGQGTVIRSNWISGNAQWGVDLQRSGDQLGVANAQILSNTIGLNILNDAVANGAGGVGLTETTGALIGAASAGNTISGNNGPGVYVVGTSASGPAIRANRIGTNPTGLAVRQNVEGISVVNATGVVIGGTNSGEGNLISGNQNNGIIVGGTAAGTTIQGNLIGTNLNGIVGGLANGVASTGCCYSGVALIGQATGTILGGGAPGAGNLIAGNPTGIWTGSGNSTIRGNTIERNTSGGGAVWVQDSAQVVIAGNTIRLNDGIGVGFNGANGGVTVGGALAGDANVITGNNGAGINVGSGSSQVRIQSNQIFDNSGLGTDLVVSGFWGDGPTPNDAGDADTGTNGLQNFPVLSAASSASVNFALDAPAGTYTLEFFANAACDASGYGEGHTLLGTLVTPALSGTAVFSAAAPSGWFVTATATDALGNTSEFSACAQVPVATTPATVTLSGLSAIFDGTPKSVGYTTVPAGLNVTVTYDGSTAPTAIGAYFVQATVASPGYSGSATANLKIASTLAVGGGGGGPYARSCGPGVFATGFGANNGSSYGLWNAWLQCETGGPTERFVLDNSQPMNLTSTCGANQVMVGFYGYEGLSDGTAGPFVKALGARCQDRSGVGSVTSIPLIGNTYQTAVGPFDCPAGQAVVGVVGGAGGVLDSVALVCAAIPTPGPANTAWSASGNGIVTLQNDGTATGQPAFQYQHNGGGCGNPSGGPYSGSWQFSTVAAVTGTVDLAWAWNGFHSYFGAYARVEAFVQRGGLDVWSAQLQSAGPSSDGVSSPVGGFSFAGNTPVSVQASDVFGFRLYGSHGDCAEALQGTFSVAIGGWSTPAPEPSGPVETR